MSPFQTVILSLFSLFIITTSLHCNITGTRQTQAVSNLDLIYNVSPLKLSFQQSSGYLISDIAAQIPKEIVDASNNPHFEPCVMDYHSGLIPYLNLVLLDNIFPPASNTNQNQLWSDINNNDSWVHKSTTYLSTVHLSASERSPVVIKMKYCRDYKSLQEINMECPPIDTAAELARLHNKSKKPLAIGLGFLAIGVVLISIAVFFLLVHQIRTTS